VLDAAVKALTQIASPPLRWVLLKTAGLALLGLILLGNVVLPYLIGWPALLIAGDDEAGIQPMRFVLTLMLVTALDGRFLFAGILIMPAATALVAGFVSDEIAAATERMHYPGDPPGLAVRAVGATVLLEGARTALLAVLAYVCTLPLMLLFGLGLLIFFVANAWLLGRQFFLLAAMRFHPAEEARRLRKAHRGTVMLAGTFIAAFVSIPILNLATPLFGTAFMVHMHKKLVGSRRELIEHT
jgi:uncharacterized protein involved in cysteine biosynthesis